MQQKSFFIVEKIKKYRKSENFLSQDRSVSEIETNFSEHFVQVPEADWSFDKGKKKKKWHQNASPINPLLP